MPTITQAELDALKTHAFLIAPDGKSGEVEADLKSKANWPLDMQANYVRKLIDAFEAPDLARYLPAPTNGDGSRKRPDRSNPWSKEGFNLTAQMKLVKAIGETKAAAIAAAAGCKLGDTKHNPDYV
jgi:hypothetical protein